MLKYYFRETFAGRLLNILSGDRWLKAPQPHMPTSITNNITAEADAIEESHPGAESEFKDSAASSRLSTDAAGAEDVQIAQLVDRLSSQIEDQEKMEFDGMPTSEQARDLEKGRSDHLVGWNGDTDPENPRNWPMWLKIWSTCMISFLTFSIYVCS